VTEAQEPDQLRIRAIVIVGGAVVALTLVLVGIAWLLVARPPVAEREPAPSVLEHGLFDQARGGADANAGGAARLDRFRWIDRGAQLVQLPIERAIDAVVAKPSLIGGHR